MENSAEGFEIDGADAVPAPAADPGGHPADLKVRAVLAVLAGRSSPAREAKALGVTEADIDQWKKEFVDAGSRGLLAPERSAASPPSIAELTAANEALRSALRRAIAEAGSWRGSAQGSRGLFIEIEEIRRRRGMPVERFCTLIGVSRRAYFRNLALPAVRAALPGQRRARSRGR